MLPRTRQQASNRLPAKGRRRHRKARVNALSAMTAIDARNGVAAAADEAKAAVTTAEIAKMHPPKPVPANRAVTSHAKHGARNPRIPGTKSHDVNKPAKNRAHRARTADLERMIAANAANEPIVGNDLKAAPMQNVDLAPSELIAAHDPNGPIVAHDPNAAHDLNEPIAAHDPNPASARSVRIAASALNRESAQTGTAASVTHAQRTKSKPRCLRWSNRSVCHHLRPERNRLRLWKPSAAQRLWQPRLKHLRRSW